MIRIEKNLTSLKPLIKYAIIGVLGTAIDVGSLYVFVDIFKLPLLVSATGSFMLAVVNNFILNKIWTFQNTSKNYRKLFIKFFIVSIIGLGLTLICLQVLTNILHIWYILAKLITSVIVLTWNFLGNKMWTFRESEKKKGIAREKDTYDLSIIIPAYNEEKRIGKTIEAIQNYINQENLDAEIIIVSDGSKDKTIKITEEYTKNDKRIKLISYTKNQGKGFAIKTGVNASEGKYILFTDADNSTPIEELKKIMYRHETKKAEVVIGSRYLEKSSIHIGQPRYRVLIGRLGNFLIQLLLLDGIKDTQCGFKFFEHAAAKEIFSRQKIQRFGFDMEALVIAKNLGYKIEEVPVNWFNSAESRVRPIKDSWITFRELIHIKLNLLAGRYYEDSCDTKAGIQ